jgi:hypothetical protein
LIDWVNGMSGDALRAMIVRARWIVTAVFNFGGSDRGGLVGRLCPAIVVRLASFTPVAVARRRATAAFGGTGCAEGDRGWCAGVLDVGSRSLIGAILRLRFRLECMRPMEPGKSR